MPSPAYSAVVVDCRGLDALITTLQARGYSTVGPRVRDDAVVYGEIESTADLPAGCSDVQGPGSYRLQRDGEPGFFRHTPGADSWKRFFFPPSRQNWALRLDNGVFRPVADDEAVPRYAIIGARACELAAMAVQDQVFGEQQYRDDSYLARRAAAFVVAVHCGQAAATCFCDAMGTGPRCESGFDLALTELLDDGDPVFLLEPGSDEAAALLATLPTRPATGAEQRRAAAASERARAGQQRRPAAAELPALLARNPEHPHWSEIAERCLACGNCTLACPTCFCSDFEDSADLAGGVAERRQQWSSCFNASFSYTHGGSVRGSTAARYRQWLTHKLSGWVEQFGRSGCVGCGRCITWCPVGIDITEEVAVLAVLAARDGERTSAAADSA